LEGSVTVDNLKVEPAVVTITLEKINSVLGTDIGADEVESIFNRLGFEVAVQGSEFEVTVPTRRGDITIEEDLLEEVARLYGYDNLPLTLPEGDATAGSLTPFQIKRRATRRNLEGSGLMQAITYSLTNDKKAGQFALHKREPIRLIMPMSEERSNLRLSIIPQLLEALSYNIARQNDSLAFYEIGSVFLKEGNQELPSEHEHIAGAVTGLWNSHPWQGEKKPVDFFVVKGILEGLFEELGVTEHISFRQAERDGLHPGRTAEILLDDTVIGVTGQVHPEVQKDMDLNETYVFEIEAEPVFNYNLPSLQYTAIPRYPSITRDIALVVGQDVKAGELKSIIKEAGGRLLKEVSIFDLYQGEHMEPGKKSLAYSLKYFDPARTLTDDEVVKAHNKVLEAVKDKAGAELRG
jgi:phenylalanyl-tRNA synthetase beta chain